MPATKLVYLLGIMPRSGTNFLHRVLRIHQQVEDLEQRPSEDFLLHNSHLLQEYSQRALESWLSYSTVPDSDRIKLLRGLGEGLESFLLNHRESFNQENKSGELLDNENWIYRIARTPSVYNLDLFPLLTESKAIIIIRDGRSMIESGMRSFGWVFEEYAQRWAVSAKLIREVKEQHPDQFLIIYYEDLYGDRVATVEKICAFLGLDPALFDTNAEVAVYGSSTFFEKDKGINWGGTKATEGFTPLNRWEKWSTARLARFNWIAGEESKAFGYELTDHGGGIWDLYNVICDVLWKVYPTLKNIGRALIPLTLRRQILWNRGKKYREKVIKP